MPLVITKLMCFISVIGDSPLSQRVQSLKVPTLTQKRLFPPVSDFIIP